MIPTLSKNDHFKFGYEGGWFNARTSPSDAWRVAYGPVEREPFDWRRECIDTALTVSRHASAPIWILFSGGLDSEVVVQSFLFASVAVKIAITRFAYGRNAHDIAYAIRFCERHDLEYRFLDLDIEKFFESGAALRYAEETKCVQPQLLHTMWAMDQLDGYPVLGSGECLLLRGPSAQDLRSVRYRQRPARAASAEPWFLLEKERVAAWYRYLMNRGRDGCAGFFQFTPENMMSFLTDPSVVALLADKGEGDISQKKRQIYNRHFMLEARPKFHGFESVMRLDGAVRRELEARYSAWDAVALTEHGDLLRQLKRS